jgi:hypothetical protein
LGIAGWKTDALGGTSRRQNRPYDLSSFHDDDDDDESYIRQI